MWEFPASTIDTDVGDQSGTQISTTRTLTFNSIRTSQAGVYRCRATISIEGLNPVSQTASQAVRVLSKLSVQTILHVGIKLRYFPICSSPSCI